MLTEALLSIDFFFLYAITLPVKAAKTIIPAKAAAVKKEEESSDSSDSDSESESDSDEVRVLALVTFDY